ncbi:MAG: type II secretion system protein [Betaproteobacteria bacterium]|nr:type II secretion system protein [Betaproteobacteria bacterium]
MFIVAILSGGLALVGEVWHTAAQREKESVLLYVGNQYRRAIERYYLNGPRQYPRNLTDLLKDPRKSGTERYLRQIYLDPITGQQDWGFVKTPDGGIMGVHSLSEARPLKSTGFKLQDRDFEIAAKYSEWKFVYTPPLQSAPKPAAKPPAAALIPEK